jgi:hypothetical protein
VLFFGCKAEVEHVHRYNFGWSYDSQYHWEASICDCGSEMVKEKTAHSFRSGTCTVCGYDSSSKTSGNLLVTKYGEIVPINKELVAGDLVIPSEIDGIQVTSIPDFAFYMCPKLKSVSILDGVKEIGRSAFSGCTGLKTFEMADSVCFLWSDFYNGCTIFAGCESLEFVKISKSLKNIEEKLFQGCTNLNSVIIPEGVKAIENQAFCECSNLKEIVIPSSLDCIESKSFEGCSCCLFFPEGTKSIDVEDLSVCCGITSMTIPVSVTSFGTGGSIHSPWYPVYCLTSINYNGTKEQWSQISKESKRTLTFYLRGIEVVHCTDGDIPHESI